MRLPWKYTLQSLHGACVANAQGNCANSAQLLDFGQGLCNYTTAIADGVHSGITGIFSGIEALQHPVDTLQSCAQSLAYLLSFLPIQYAHHDHIMSYEEWGRLFRQDCERADKQWNAAKEHITGQLLVQIFTAVTVGYLTHAVLRLCAPYLAQGAVYAGKVALRVPIIAAAAHATIRTLNTLNKAVKKGIRLTTDKIEKIVNHHFKTPETSPVLATPQGIIMLPLDNSLQVSKNGLISFTESANPISMPYLHTATSTAQESSIITPASAGLITDAAEVAAEMERIRSVPHEVIVDRIMNTGSYLGYTAAECTQVIENFKNPAINVPIVFFIEGITRFKDIPGGTQIINNVFKHILSPRGHNRVNGSLYELAAATNFEIITKEAMLELSKKIPSSKDLIEHDFMTKSSLGEVKNVYWPRLIPPTPSHENEINGFITQLTFLSTNAQKTSTIPILITRHPIPEELATIWQTIVNLNIEYKVCTLQ